MCRIAITNLKGGVGKTTTAVNLSAGLAAKLAPRDERVLLIDLDSQIEASASSWLGVQDRGRRFLEVLEGEGELEELVRATDLPGLDLIPGSESLARAEAGLAHEPGSQAVFRSRVDGLPQRWRTIIIDTPPTQGWLMYSGLAAATDVLVPIESGSMALGSLHGLNRVINMVRERLNPELRLFGVLQCRADTRTRLYREVDGLLREQFGQEALRTIIRSDVKLLEAPGHQEDIFTYAPESRAAADYTALAAEVGKKLGLEAFESGP
ncbi:MAG: ParA family protein [bacterium]|nr:ParA family protein [bacterium]